MTTVAVLADPPHDGVLTGLRDMDIGDHERRSLYRAMFLDICEAIQASGGDLLVNYRPTDRLPEEVTDPKETLEAMIEEEFPTNDDIRYEKQVGSTFDARVGNTITHLLEREAVGTAAVVTPRAAMLGRPHIDSAAMKLRRNEVVLGPTNGGGVHYAGFGELIDFSDAYRSSAVETLTERARKAGLGVDFLPMLADLGTPAGLRTALPLLRARSTAELGVPSRTYGELTGTQALSKF